jgi:hypothetical protein
MTVDMLSILAVLVSRPPAWSDRDQTREQRAAMLYPEAEAISRVAKNTLEVGILISQSDSDTHNEGFVLRDECQKSRFKCDHGHALGPWSVHGWCTAAWTLPHTSEASLEEQARCVLRQFWHGAHAGRQHALTPIHAGFAALGSRPWAWPEAGKRAKLALEMEQLLAHPPELVGSGL